MDSAAGAPTVAFPYSFPPITLAGLKALTSLLTTDEHVLLNIKAQGSRINVLLRKGVYGVYGLIKTIVLITIETSSI